MWLCHLLPVFFNYICWRAGLTAKAVFLVPEHVVRLNQIYTELRTRLSAKPVARVMFLRDGLSLDELESILSRKTENKAANSLLKIVVSQHDRDVYDCFIDARCQ